MGVNKGCFDQQVLMVRSFFVNFARVKSLLKLKELSCFSFT